MDPRGDEVAPVTVEQELGHLVGLLDGVTARVDALESEVMAPDALAGASPSATENRSIRAARARLARDRAREMRAEFGEVRRRTAEMAASAAASAARAAPAAPAASPAPGRAQSPSPAPAPYPAPGDPGPRPGVDGLVELACGAGDRLAAVEPDAVPAAVVAEMLRAVPGARGVSLRLRAGDRSELLAATDAATRELDEVQMRLGRGPTAEAAAAGPGEVLAGDLTGAADPAGAWVERARALGVGGVVAWHLAGRVGYVLTVHTTAPVDEDDRRVAALVATQAGVALSAAARCGGLERALGTRDVIGQAKGLLMAEHGVGPDRAFSLLVRASQHRNVKIALLAEQLVAAVAAGPETTAPSPERKD